MGALIRTLIFLFGILAASLASNKGLSNVIILQTSSTLHQLNDSNRSASSQLWIWPSYALTQRLKLSALTIVNKDHTGEQRASISNTSIVLRDAGPRLNPFLKLSFGGSTLIPTNKDSRERESLITAIKFSPRIVLDPEKSITQLKGYYELSLGKNFHTFSTSTTGISNVSWSLNHTVRLSFFILETLSLTSTLAFTNGLTYASNFKQKFEWEQELSYDMTEHLSIAAGLNHSGNLYKDNGQDSNLALFNEEVSSIYGAISYVF